MWLGLARRRTLILPSWKGWLLLVLLFAVMGFLLLRSAYPYLAPQNQLPDAAVVILEGWVSHGVLAQARRELEEERCQLICTAGVDLEKGEMLLPWKDWATVAAETLKKLGVPDEKIISAPGGPGQRNRTYIGFQKAKEKLAALEEFPLKINVITEGPHGRRSLIVARKVFGKDATIGMISVDPPYYDPKRWWASSIGTKAVVTELIGSAYELLAGSGRK